MNRKELIERYKNAILEMYNKAENASGVNMQFDSYEDIIDNCKPDKIGFNGEKRQVFLPYDAFYLDKKTQDEIISKATKGCKYSYRWPHKIPFGGDKKFDAYLKEMKKYEEEKKNLTRWFRKKRMDQIVKKYNLQLRSADAESLKFSIWNNSPNIDKESYEKRVDAYKMFKRKRKIPDNIRGDIEALDYLVKHYQCKHVESR